MYHENLSDCVIGLAYTVIKPSETLFKPYRYHGWFIFNHQSKRLTSSRHLPESGQPH